MPVHRFYRHGLTAGTPPMNNSHRRALRGDVEGWSDGATRRNTRFLYGIRDDLLTGAGVAVTLTLRDCPPDSDAWHRIRKAWVERMRYAGMVRLHWVTEWQRRGVPHLHAAIWFPGKQYDLVTPVEAWLELAEQYGVGLRGQFAKPIDGPVGWFQYVSKHAARGVKHYQRSGENIPTGWQKKTGRVWGKGGDWPEQQPWILDLQGREGDGGHFAFRRLVRSWRIADARVQGDRFRLRSARAMLTCNDRPRSELRGVSEWCGLEQSKLFVGNLASRGYQVIDRGTGEMLNRQPPPSRQAPGTFPRS